MNQREAILTAIYEAVKADNIGLEPAQQLALSPDTALYGPGGALDSLRLVTLIAGVEHELEDRLGLSLVLADEKAVSQRRSPFLTIDTLATYVEQLIAEETGPART
ncbi:MAG: hypothetical protein V4773_03460 [Verrucomicrobiota bacterium]